MISVLINASIVCSSDGYVRKLVLEFAEPTKQRKRIASSLLPGMTRVEVADSLVKLAKEVYQPLTIPPEGFIQEASES